MKKFLFVTCIALFSIATAFARRPDTVAGQNLNIVFIGNSITHGAGLKDFKTDAPPNQTCAYLQKQPGVGRVAFANMGMSGYTTVDFLPATAKAFNKAEDAARAFTNKDAQLVFSIILGTNDSAIQGPNGSPVTADDYALNLSAIADRLLLDFPGCKLVFQQPTWYSPNTQNRSKYLAEGLARLQTYFPKIKAVVKSYSKSNPKQVFMGDTDAFKFLRKTADVNFQHENGVQGVFYLHPNKQGAAILGDYWGKAIYARLFKHSILVK